MIVSKVRNPFIVVRRRLGYTQKEMAKALGLSLTTWASYERFKALGGQKRSHKIHKPSWRVRQADATPAASQPPRALELLMLACYYDPELMVAVFATRDLSINNGGH